VAGSGLVEAISSESPCGEDLEDTQLLASFDAYRLFGQAAPLSPETDWREIRDQSLEALGKSKDFRLLAHYGCAVLRTDGLAEFATVLEAMAKWLQEWWAQAYPRVDEDAILRRNALNGFADRMAVVDGLRRATLLQHPQLGSLSIRDIEIATGTLTPAEGESPTVDQGQLGALITATSTEDLAARHAQLESLIQSLKSVDRMMRDQGGSDAAPDFDPLLGPVARTAKLFAEQLATRAPVGAAVAGDAGGNGAAAPGAARAVGDIRSRDDALRTLDAVAAYFRANEPSSPVPLFVERAKRLVSKDFLAVLEDIVPDALAQAKAAGGVRDE
jgi:type VI secretion system protein ImpA